MVDSTYNAPGTSRQEQDDAQSKSFYVPQRVLILRRFRKHRLAMVSLVIVLFIYFVAIFAEFFAPYPPDLPNSQLPLAPPQTLHLFQDGRFSPYVNGYTTEVDAVEMRRTFIIDPEVRIPVGLFVEGYEYKLLGIFTTHTHLIGPTDPEQRIYLLGADRLGRDQLSRIVYGTRISMSIGLVGVTFSLILGIIIGGISGYYGGTVDNLIQRLTDFIRSLPTIPLWMGLAAAVPLTWDPLYVYFSITVILSFIGWTEMARVVRGKFLSLRGEDYVRSARLDGAGQFRIMFKYMLPAFTSHIIAAVTLAIPSMILAETALSFLGLGLRPPVVSWGVLLKEAQNIRTVAQASWLLAPAVPVIVAVLALNFLGDGLRDAADPYA
ncbi:MAG: ABC transporter permease [Aggregatilineales bacterium]